MRKYTMRKLSAAFLFVFLLLIISVHSSAFAAEPQNVLIVGWDGCGRETVKELLASHQLPNLAAIIHDGRLVDIDVTTGATETKSGWAQILTGYTPEITGVYSNGRYRPIPEGLTIFERAEKFFGNENVYTSIISGKSVNIDNDPPQKISYSWWMRYSQTTSILEFFSPQKRIERIGGSIIEEDGKKYVALPGKVYYLTQKGIDAFVNGLGDNEKTANYAMTILTKHKNQRFILGMIFNEPDNSGHKYGEGSKAYRNGVKTCDKWTGAITAKLKELGIYSRTLIYVAADHGFDLGHRTHTKAPAVFCATNDKLINRRGDRADISPTIMKRLGMNLSKISPRLSGHPLDEPAVSN